MNNNLCNVPNLFNHNLFNPIIRNIGFIFAIKNSNSINSLAYKSLSTTLDRFLEVY